MIVRFLKPWDERLSACKIRAYRAGSPGTMTREKAEELQAKGTLVIDWDKTATLEGT